VIGSSACPLPPREPRMGLELFATFLCCLDFFVLF
jgi:hypothetical protein